MIKRGMDVGAAVGVTIDQGVQQSECGLLNRFQVCGFQKGKTTIPRCGKRL